MNLTCKDKQNRFGAREKCEQAECVTAAATSIQIILFLKNQFAQSLLREKPNPSRAREGLEAYNAQFCSIQCGIAGVHHAGNRAKSNRRRIRCEPGDNKHESADDSPPHTTRPASRACCGTTRRNASRDDKGSVRSGAEIGQPGLQ